MSAPFAALAPVRFGVPALVLVDPRSAMSDIRIGPEYDFLEPIQRLDAEIAELEAHALAEGDDSSAELDARRERRDRLIDDICAKLTPWQRVLLSRHPERPVTEQYVEGMFRSYRELHGDRAYGDDPAIITALGYLEGRRVLIVGHRKGLNQRERLACNFGCAHPEGYRKAMLKMKLAEKIGVPIVTFINTPGAYPGIGAEKRGQAMAIAESIQLMARLRVPIVVSVIGEGGSGGALGLGVGDLVQMLEYSYYSVISPEGCASILWKDAGRKEDAARALKLAPADLRELQVIDGIVPEPRGGAHRDPETAIDTLKHAIRDALNTLDGVSIDTLLERRYEKLRAYGQYLDPATPATTSGVTAP